jgi:ATP-dependent DNA helicase RecG
MNLSALKRLVAKGEGTQLEFKRSTGELREALQTVCAFLNGDGGTVLFGVRPDATIIGQEVSDQTLREMTQAMDGFEPPVRIETDRVQLPSGRDVLVFHVEGLSDTVPFTFEGRVYERIESTTRRMPQRRYEQLLLNRAHSRRRWENQGAEGTTLQDIDRAEVFRVVDSARAAGRLVEPVGRDLGRVLDRLSVRRGGRILRAAVVLFGTRFLPDFPQCELRLARFRGIDKTEFLDQQQLRATAFKLLEEALLFCQRHLPLPGRIDPGRLERVDRPLIPPDALREIVVNALIHRDYTIAGGAVSLAIFDDRVEIWSAGRLPLGITPDDLSREHDSIQRNPIIAEVFYRAGLIEKWGRGTNRVIAQCREAGIAPPEFREVAGSTVVTFRVQVGITTQVTPQVTPQVIALLKAARQPHSREELQRILGLKDRRHFQKTYIEALLAAGWLEMTIPDRPRSRLQRYRITAAGQGTLNTTSGERP